MTGDSRVALSVAACGFILFGLVAAVAGLDKNAPQMSLSDDQIVTIYPWVYKDLKSACKKRYGDFKENQTFRNFIRQVKQDANCAFERKLDPNNVNSQGQWRYKPGPTLNLLDTKYTLSPT